MLLRWIIKNVLSVVIIAVLSSAAVQQPCPISSHFSLCAPPPCTPEQIGTLWPTSDPKTFYQCGQDLICGWAALERPCAPGTVFGFKEQVCIWEYDWVDPCGSAKNASQLAIEDENEAFADADSTTDDDFSSTTEETGTEDTETDEPSTPEGETKPPPTCQIPACTNDETHILWPVGGSPESFYQCEPDFEGGGETQCVWKVIQRNCENGQYFGYEQQECVEPEDWNNYCSSEIETTTPDDEDTTTSTEETTDETSTYESTTDEGPGICIVPECTDEQVDKLWGVANQFDAYYQCVPLVGEKCEFETQLKLCDEGLLFSWQYQACVTPDLWQDPCVHPGTTTETPETTTPFTTPQPPELCVEPSCSDDEVTILWPHLEPTQYYQCIPVPEGEWEVVVKTCEDELYFGFEAQKCINPDDWFDVCFSTTTETETEPPTTVTTTEIPETSTEPEDSSSTTTTQESSTVTTQESSTTTPGTPGQFCIQPDCESKDGINTLWPHEDPAFFYQCAPAAGGCWAPVKMPCPKGLRFGFDEQYCIWECDWVDPCANISTTQQPTVPTAGSTLPGESTTPPTVPTAGSTTLPTVPTAQSTESSSNPTLPTQEITSSTQGPTLPTAASTTDGTEEGGAEGTCIPIDCSGDPKSHRLFPHPDPNFFYQCAPSTGCDSTPVQMPCSKGTWFSWEEQVCIWPCDWVDPCGDLPGKTDPEHPDGEATVETCIPADCSSVAHRNMLYPHSDKKFYYQCAPGVGVGTTDGYLPITRPCAPGTVFSYQNQVCVFETDWIDPCRGGMKKFFGPKYLPPNVGDNKELI